MSDLFDYRPITEMYSSQNITQDEIKYLSDKDLNKTLTMYKKELEDLQSEIDVSGRYPSFMIKSQMNDVNENIKALERETYRRKTEIEKVSSRVEESVQDGFYRKKKLSTFLKEKIK